MGHKWVICGSHLDCSVGQWVKWVNRCDPLSTLAQKHYKAHDDKKQYQVELKLGDWVLVYFPKGKVGRNHRLSRPWHGPYRIIEKRDPDITLCKVYFPEEKSIQVHQTRIQPCPVNFPAGYYWYGSRRVGPGRPPKWVDRLMATNCESR